MNFTSIEQSKKLVELGLDPKTADLHYRKWNNKWCTELPSYKKMMEPDEDGGTIGSNYVKPCWSFSALIDIIVNTCSNVCLICSKDEDSKLWSCYFDYKGSTVDHTESFSGKTKMNALLDLIFWLLENNYIK